MAIVMISTAFHVKRLFNVSIKIKEMLKATVTRRKKKPHNKNGSAIKLSSKLPFVSKNSPSSQLDIAATKAELLHTKMIALAQAMIVRV